MAFLESYVRKRNFVVSRCPILVTNNKDARKYYKKRIKRNKQACCRIRCVLLIVLVARKIVKKYFATKLGIKKLIKLKKTKTNCLCDILRVAHRSRHCGYASSSFSHLERKIRRKTNVPINQQNEKTVRMCKFSKDFLLNLCERARLHRPSKRRKNPNMTSFHITWKKLAKKQYTCESVNNFRTIIRLLAHVPLRYLIRGRSSLSSPEFSSITMLFSVKIRLETNSVNCHRHYHASFRKRLKCWALTFYRVLYKKIILNCVLLDRYLSYQKTKLLYSFICN